MMMRLDVNFIEDIYVAINAVAVFFTAAGLIDAWDAKKVVKELNGHARELVTAGNVRREGLLLVVQLTLLVIAMPSLLSPGDAPLNYFICALIFVSFVLLLISTFNAHERHELTKIALVEVRAKRLGIEGGSEPPLTT